MRRFFGKRSASPDPVAANSNPGLTSYLTRLYVESRQILFHILLGETLPPKEPFPVDPAQTAEILQRIEALIVNDEHLDRYRETIGKQFPGSLALMFNLADKNDQLFPSDRLRESIRKHVHRHGEGFTGQPLDADDYRAIEELKGSSKLQQQLAYLANFTPDKWLLEQEVPIVLQSRWRRVPDLRPPAGTGIGHSSSLRSTAEPSGCVSYVYDPYAWSRDTGRLTGLCLSGGGIRSATFCLGILQGLSSKDLLRRFDYCSSVSGGGYIHQWFAAWVKREEALPSGAPGSTGLDAVCRQLIPLPRPGCGPQTPEPIRWLRRYSNYLTPQTGLLSADTWVTFAIWMRNTFLNQIILISLLVSLLLVPHLFLLPNPGLPKINDIQATNTDDHTWLQVTSSVALIILVSLSYLLLVHELVAGLKNARERLAGSSRLGDQSTSGFVVLPSLIVSIFLCEFGFYFRPFGLPETWHAVGLCIVFFLALLLLTLAIAKAGGAMDKRPGVGEDRHSWRMVGFTLTAVLASLAGTGTIMLARNTFVTGNPLHFNARPAKTAPSSGSKVNVKVSTGDSEQVNVSLQVLKADPESMQVAAVQIGEMDLKWRLVLVFGPFVVMMVPFLAIMLQCGLIGSDLADWVLEWLARVRAWAAMYSLAWTLLMGIALFGHQLIDRLLSKGNSWINWTAVGTWVLTTAGGVLAGKSSSSSGEPGSPGNSRIMNFLIAAGPPVYILGLLLILAWATQEALAMAGISNRAMSIPRLIGSLFVVVIVPTGIFALFGWRVGVNEFSMHSYYRNRLARCYLGASNTKRDPDPLTGFDTADVEDLHLGSFLPSKGYSGPLPVFCASINISVGEDLAWQERKAASFAFGPVLSGYHVPWTGKRYSGQLSYNGFVPTERFAYPNGGVHVSTVAAISGAAISPNWGYHTNPAMAFLLTMFNVRLGWWLPNPRRSYLAFDPNAQPPVGKDPFPRPKFAPSLLWRELLGQIGDDRDFVYLTDGGHFDNMGLYELVRRRCYEIVICDAEEDIGPVFAGIGMAIRKCRIDFGAEIDLDLNQLATDAATKVSKVHWILGSIRYPETSKAEPGTIIYIKSSIMGNEAADIYNYRLQHQPFPQDSTLDQWFTESQFESYRRLGQEVVDQCPYLA
jgi:hypothetical protein